MAQPLRTAPRRPGHGRSDEPTDDRAPALRRLAPYALAVAPLVAVSLHILRIRKPITFWGDQALTDIAASRALHLHELLGPYSRFGWHHPGPAWLFAIGLFRWIGGSSTAVTLVAAVVVQAIAAGLVVLTGRHLAGEAGAWVAALAVLAVTQTLGIAERVGYLWNPWAIVIPALLYVGVCALLADRTRPPLPPMVAVAVTGSFLVQTHVGSALLVVVLPVVALLLREADEVVRRRRYLVDPPAPPPRDRRRTTRWTVVGLVALALMWTPPLIQQFTHNPGNMTELVRYSREPHGRHTTRETLVAVGDELRAFPFLKDTPERFQESDNGIYAFMGRRYEYTPFLYAIAAALLAALAAWRRDRLAVILAGFGGAGVVIGVESARLADGLLFPYLVAWTGVAAVPVWLSALVLGVRALPQRRSVARAGSAALVAVTTLVSAACVYQAVYDRELEPHVTFPAGVETAKVVDPVLDAATSTDHPDGPVLLHLATGGAMPVAAAIADDLFRQGRPWRVNREFVFMFGDGAKPRHDETIELYLARIEDNLPPPANGREIGLVRNTRIYVIDRAASSSP